MRHVIVTTVLLVVHEELFRINLCIFVVYNKYWPVFKQYRVLDLQDGTVVAMTETGDVKQAIPVIDQSKLWSRLKAAFDSGRGSVRVLVLADQGSELAVEMKVIHGSRL